MVPAGTDKEGEPHDAELGLQPATDTRLSHMLMSATESAGNKPGPLH